MSTKSRFEKAISLLIALVIIFGNFTSLAFAREDKVSLAKVDLKEMAEKKIDSDLKYDLENNDIVEVMVYMREQTDTESVVRTSRNRLSKVMTPYRAQLEIRKDVIESLKYTAETSQGDLLAYLEREKDAGRLEDYSSYHIVNMLYVKARKEVVEEISYMAEVERIFKNNVHTMEMPRIGENDLGLENLDPLWNIKRVGADLVWDLGFDGSGVVIGQLDSGVDWTHPVLKNHWRGYNPRTEETNPEKSWFDPVYNSTLPADSDAHGTHVMGTMVGQEEDGSNPIGVAPGARWIAARVFNKSGSTTDKILLDSAEWMLAPGGDPSAAPDVINNSWGGGDGLDDWYLEAIKAWRAAGIFPVFSAGNQRAGEPAPWPGSISVPSNYIESFAVAAVDRYDQRGSFSKLGPSPYDSTAIKPNISAPGVNVYSSIPGGEYGSSSGTSMASPHVTGVVALMKSANAALTVEEIESILSETADPLVDSTYPASPNFGYGYGMVNAFEAVSKIADGTGYISGRVLVEGRDADEPVIIHQQKVFETFAGSNVEITAQVIDDIAITEVELLVKQQNSPYWMLVPMNRVSGDYKDGIYKGTIGPDMLIGEALTYRIRTRDFAETIVVSEDYQIDIKFGIIPGYIQNFEEDIMGWKLEGIWQWGQPMGNDPKPIDGKKLVGTILGGNYPSNSNDWLISPPIDLRDKNLPSASLRFYEWFEMENNYDKGYLLVSDDYGQNWVQVGAVRTGESKGWKGAIVDLDSYIGSDKPIFVAFRLTSDSGVNKQGWYIDNVELVGIDTSPPSLPKNLQAEPQLTGINLTWDPVIDVDLSKFIVYRSLEEDDNFEIIGETSQNNYFDDEIEIGVRYYYKLASEDFSGNRSEFSQTISSLVSEATTIYYSDFEEDNGGFVLGTTSGTENPWQWGRPTSGPNEAKSGEKLWATNLSGDYNSFTNAYIESGTISLPADKNPILTFEHWVDMEAATIFAYDYGQVFISADGGNNWVNITPTSDGKYTDRIRSWQKEIIPLSNYRGKDVKIRFFFRSDGSGNYPGWYIDDVGILGVDLANTGIQERGKEPLLESKEDKTALAPIKASHPIERGEEKAYRTITDRELDDILQTVGGIPVEEAYITILETGRTVKVDPVTGKYNMRMAKGEYTLLAESYGHYSAEAQARVEEGKTVHHTFILDPKPTGNFKGRVYDRYWNNPIPNAKIRLLEDPKIPPVISDENGNFEIPSIYIGDYRLRVLAEGYYQEDFEILIEDGVSLEKDLGLKILVDQIGEIAYDDGSAEDSVVLREVNNGLAVRFTPNGYTNVTGARIYLWSNQYPLPGGNRLGFTIYATEENGGIYRVGEPIFVDNLVRGAWNDIDLSSFGFVTDRDFYISTIQDKPGTHSPALGIDKSAPGDRSYINLEGDFELINTAMIDGGLMIRALAGNLVDSPEITNLEEEHYTNQDNIKLEGRVLSDAKVNLYVDGQIVESKTTINNSFDFDIDLTKETTKAMVTAEINGRQTEPSKEITIIKDQDKPILDIYSPLEGTNINEEELTVKGNVSDNQGIKDLLINGKKIDIDSAGNFSHRMMVDPGDFEIEIKAIDLAGNMTVVERTIRVILEGARLENMKPDEDINLSEGDILRVSFESQAGGRAYFRLAPQISLANDQGAAIKMKEIKAGYYEGQFKIPEGFAIKDGIIEFEFIDLAGNRTVETAAGKIRVINQVILPMADLPANTIILGDQAFDVHYLENNEEVYDKLINWQGEVYIKLDKNTLVDREGNIITINLLPDQLTYYDRDGRISSYKR